jgi:NADH-quinone oxidoreductase subunit H
LAIIFFISILAETNRVPFDLPEAEAELVAGYNVEYSAFTFAAFFLGEYSNILIMSTLYVLFFFGGGDYVNFLFLKTSFSCDSFFLVFYMIFF